MDKILRYDEEEDAVEEIGIRYPSRMEAEYAEDYYPSSEAAEDEIHLLQTVFATVRNHWFLILSLVLSVMAMTIVYVAQQPNYFRSEARVQVNTEINPALTSETGSSVIVRNAGGDPAYFATQLQILEGAGLMRRVISTLDLQNNKQFLDPQSNKNLSVWQNVQKMLGFYKPPVQKSSSELASNDGKNNLSLKREAPIDKDQEAAQMAPFVNLLKRNLDVSPVKDNRTSAKETRLIDINYTHLDPAVAAKIANAIGDAYVLQNLENKVRTNASAGDFLQKRVAELQSEIRNSEERLMNYARTNRIISLDESQNTVVQRLTTLNSSLGQAENERIAAQAAFQAAKQNEMRNATAESKDPQVTALETQLTNERQKLAKLKTEYTDDWHQVIGTKKQIQNIENQLETFKKRASGIEIARLQERLSETVAREKVLRANFETQQGEVIRQNEASINYKIIQQEIDTNKGLLNGLLQKSKENEIVISGTQNNVLVLDRALVPTRPSGPDRSRNLLVALIGSLGFGFGLAFVIDWLDDTVNMSQDVESQLGLPLLAAIPALPTSIGKKLLPSGLALTKQKRRIKRTYDVEAFEDPHFLESYVQLGTYLNLSTAGGPPKVILVTSGEEGEGKTMTAINLAASLARNKDKVLIIDADLRCSRIHRIKDLSNAAGLTTLLAVEKVTRKIIEETIQSDPSSNLDIMTAGAHTVNPGNLLSSDEMVDLLKALSKIYKHIIIDSPPVLYFADSAVMSTLSDAVIMVVRDGKSSKTSVISAKKTLQKLGAKIVGVVLNGVPVGKTNYYNYSYYESNSDRDDDEPTGALPASGSNDILDLR